MRVGGRECLRKLRGSHLIFPWARLPLTRAVTFLHPADGRPLYVLPWGGVTLAATADVDHGSQVEPDPAISADELDYILAGLDRVFPGLELSEGDVQASFAGVRPVVNTGQQNPSRESREYVLWNENGLLTVTGGKLTTFRLMAQKALRAVRRRLPGSPQFDARDRMLDPLPADAAIDSALTPSARLRLWGRHGAEARELVCAARPGQLAQIAPSEALWAELRWAARAEGVVHLDDLLLRRVRLGLLLPHGAAAWMDQIRAVARPELGWDDARWECELAAYLQLWRKAYSLPTTQRSES